ncbi:hypothetical protein PF008_g11199 [Phytophthora fragariae]|uniref:Uncharacterized protein n=1 Tax=Phytophthora fragariae TaxID=53985 RepID=A0A6G0RRK6_9STRA|nr:hypothetical protein PF008_g11199 [Phytophthora fragariae]
MAMSYRYAFGTKDGVLRRYYTTKEYRLLPSYFTWSVMHSLYIMWAVGARVKVKEPSLSSFRTVLKRICPDNRTRSPRDNVCDACVIYRNMMDPEPTVDDMQAGIAHVDDAKVMCRQYNVNCDTVTSTSLVTRIDFAQNIALPPNALAPLPEFDFEAKKGNTEVISMLDTYARMRNIDTMWKGSKHWHICADNCGVQAKNNYVLQLLVF